MTANGAKATLLGAMLFGCATTTQGNSPTTSGGGEIAWSSSRHPTDEQRQLAEARHRTAAKHRSESAALRAAEANACAGISDRDREMSPFEHLEDISSVRSFSQKEWTNAEAGSTLTKAGAIVTFRALPGMTTEWFQRLVDCQLARNAALGARAPEVPNCPLVPGDVEAHVFRAPTGFAVVISSGDARLSTEIQERAQRLAQSQKAMSSAAPGPQP